MRRDGRMADDTLEFLGSFNAETERRHDRRALDASDLAEIVDAARRGPEAEGVSGVDRAMLYRLAAGTGFRAAELRSLTHESFDLIPVAPTVVVAAAYSKRRREDRQPLPPDLARDLSPYLAGKPRGTPVLIVPHKTAAMLRVDLEAAGIPYRDAAGQVADFHSLRASFITLIVRGGASVKTAQSLAAPLNPRADHRPLREDRNSGSGGGRRHAPSPRRPPARRGTDSHHGHRRRVGHAGGSASGSARASAGGDS